jgi:hypothetical protein
MFMVMAEPVPRFSIRLAELLAVLSVLEDTGGAAGCGPAP